MGDLQCNPPLGYHSRGEITSGERRGLIDHFRVDESRLKLLPLGGRLGGLYLQQEALFWNVSGWKNDGASGEKPWGAIAYCFRSSFTHPQSWPAECAPIMNSESIACPWQTADPPFSLDFIISLGALQEVGVGTHDHSMMEMNW